MSLAIILVLSQPPFYARGSKCSRQFFYLSPFLWLHPLPRCPAAHLGAEAPPFWIYPLLAQLAIDGRDRTVEYIHVQNLTARFTPAREQATACAVVCLDCLSSHGTKSDAPLEPTQTFGTSQPTFVNEKP